MECDVIFADMPWRPGYDEFNRRAGSSLGHPPWPEFVQNVSRLVANIEAPVVLLWGKHAERYMLPSEWQRPVESNGRPAILHGWRLDRFGADGMDRLDIVRLLAHRYDCLGDFCCGYGETGYIATQLGKRFVMSDFNALCIGHIAQEFTDV
tara:strand:- start:2547 stop:2999 length:453 start_codon:yes stop_codon:yes gene_type:complete